MNSTQRNEGDVTEIDYTFIRPVTEGCIAFVYYMYGTDMGSLTIGSTGMDDFYNELWTKSGDQGGRWHKGFAPISRATSKVVYEQLNLKTL